VVFIRSLYHKYFGVIFNYLPKKDRVFVTDSNFHPNLIFAGKAEANPMEQRALKNVNNCLKTNIYSYLETSGGQSYNLYLNVVHIFQHQS